MEDIWDGTFRFQGFRGSGVQGFRGSGSEVLEVLGVQSPSRVQGSPARAGRIVRMRTYRAGESIEDFCRACKTDRMHTVIAADPNGGADPRGLRLLPQRAQLPRRPEDRHVVAARLDRSGRRRSVRRRGDREPFPIVSERERIAPPMSAEQIDIEMLLRRIIREEAGISPVTPAEKWRGGTLVLRPGNPALQEKSWPIETFFHKIVMLRNRLRTLEQQVNAADLPEDVKVKLQSYISGCYGSLTSFNVLFADEEDQFKGSGGD